MNASDFYKVLIVGGSGKGKTYSFRNLDRTSTAFINAEQKPLPFKGAFKHSVQPTNTGEVREAMASASRNPDVQLIIVDSFSAYVEMALAERRRLHKGFEIWQKYAEDISDFMHYLKNLKKHTLVTAHYEVLDIEGEAEKRVKVKGREWEGMVEKEFTIVLYADALKPLDSGGRPDHRFWLTKNDTSAKCPPDIFGDDTLYIPNDVKVFITALNKYIALPVAA